MEEPAAELKERLSKFLPPHASLRNPIDITVEGTPEWYEKTLLEALPEYDAALAVYVGTPYLDSMPVAHALANAAKITGKPILTNFYVGTDIKESLDYLREHGIPNYTTGEQSVWIIDRVLSYAKHLQKDEVLPEIPRPVGSLLNQEQRGLLPEPQAMALLAKHGLPAPEHRFITKQEEVASACAAIGYPVVMKIVSPEIIHKSDVGGVKLNLEDEKAAQKAFAELQQLGQKKGFQGVMVYPMLKQGLEVILGIKRDAQFGPVILFGLGGIYSEIFHDVALRVAPVTEEIAQEMIASTNAAALLSGCRGCAAKDVSALAAAIAKFSQLPFLYPDIQEMDLNPVFVYEDGVTVADVRVIL